MYICNINIPTGLIANLFYVNCFYTVIYTYGNISIIIYIYIYIY